MSDTMRGLFFVMKGQYRRGAEPSFRNRVTEDLMHLGGYDPYSDDTQEWYMVYDNKTFNCVSCGSDLNKVLKGVYHTIKRHKGDANRYFKFVKGKREFYKESPIMLHLHEKVFEEYGDFFKDMVVEMEDLAYSELKEERPINKTRKLMSKVKSTGRVELETHQKKEVEVMTPKKVRPKVKLGVKKLQMD